MDRPFLVRKYVGVSLNASFTRDVYLSVNVGDTLFGLLHYYTEWVL